MNSIDPFSSIQTAGSLGAACLAGAADPKRKGSRKDELELNSRYARLLERVLKMEGQNPELIRQAKELVLSGRADTLEAAFETARMMLQYGI